MLGAVETLRLAGAPEVDETMGAEGAFGADETLVDEEGMEDETTVTKDDL